ncbi:MAG: geranylgeranylglyceryl/heptaprenylglyceryl phosphate synthase [Thermoprotei archaeon]|nr:MAG: geranylgeranylglyceryl/heptaprenylglyceryl phosphate synthase [Thermoprotei archaeon]
MLPEKSKRKRVYQYLLNRMQEDGCIHFALIDPEKTDPDTAAKISKIAEEEGTAAIMLGGSLGVAEEQLDKTIQAIKKNGVKLPIILFPGNINGISRYADAIWFLSVLNSTSIYHIIGAQVQGAVIVKRYGIESLSLAYLILGTGGAAGYVSYSRPIPFEHPEIATAYALAAEYLGFEFVYLEGGSGGKPVPENVILLVKKTVEIPVIVGGGIRTRELAKRAARAGADAIVTGTVLEKEKDPRDVIIEIIEGIREGVQERARPST